MHQLMVVIIMMLVDVNNIVVDVEVILVIDETGN